MTTMILKLLSAHVDQELSAAEAADVAAAVAADPALAARVVTLAKLRAAVRGVLPPVDVPAMCFAASRRLLSNWCTVALAASLLAALVPGTFFFGPSVTGEAAGMAMAIADNSAWLV